MTDSSKRELLVFLKDERFCALLDEWFKLRREILVAELVEGKDDIRVEDRLRGRILETNEILQLRTVLENSVKKVIDSSQQQ